MLCRGTYLVKASETASCEYYIILHIRTFVMEKIYIVYKWMHRAFNKKLCLYKKYYFLCPTVCITHPTENGQNTLNCFVFIILKLFTLYTLSKGF